MVQRAVEIRNQSFSGSMLPFATQANEAPYAISDNDRAREERCLEPYKSDAAFGAAPIKPQ